MVLVRDAMLLHRASPPARRFPVHPLPIHELGSNGAASDTTYAYVTWTDNRRAWTEAFTTRLQPEIHCKRIAWP